MKLFLQWFAVTVAMLFVRGEAMAQSPYYVAYNVSGSDFADGNMRFPGRPAPLVSTDDQGFSTYTFTIPAGTRDQAQLLILTGEATGWKQSYTEIKRYHSGQDTGNFEISSDPQVLYRYGNNSTTGYLYINDAARKEHTLTIRESVAGTQNVVEVSVSSAPAEPVAEGTVYDDMYVTFRVDNTAAWELARPMAKAADGWEFTFPEAREKAEFMVSHRNDYNSPSNMLNGWWYVQFSAGDKDSAEPYDMSDLNGSNLSLFPQNCNHYLLIGKPGTHTVRIKPVAESSYFMVGNGVYEQVADMKFSYTTVAPERLDVFLPLSKSDFYNDDHTRRRHYFLVGTRQGEWRLQPEWELHPDAEGRLGIFVPRVMYTGLVGVGMVDNYDDYSNGRFTLFTTAGGVRYDTESSSAILGDGRDFDFYAEDAEGSDGLRPDQDMAAVLMASQGYTDYNNGSVGYSNGMYLEPADNFINLFAQAAFGTSSAGMEMVVPEVSLVWVKDAVEKADESLVPEFTAPEEMPMGTHLGSPSEIDLPVHYSRANTLCSYYELAPQGEVTRSVKENFDVAYMAAAQCAPVSREIMAPAEPGTLAVRDIDVRAFRLPSSVEIHDGGAYHCPDSDKAPEVYAAADAVYTRKDNPLLLCRATEPVTLRHTVRMPECVAPEFGFALSNGLALTTFELDATDGNRYYVHDLQANIEVTNSAACTGDASAMMPQVAAVGFHLEPKTRTDVEFLSHDGSGVRVPSKESLGGIVAYKGMNNSFFTCMDGYQPEGEYSKDTHNWAEIAFRNPAMNLPVFVSRYSSIQKLPDEGPLPWEKDVPDLFATVAYHYPFLVKESATESAMLSRAASSPAYTIATLTAHTTVTRPIAASEIMTGITGVEADSEAPTEWYNLQGIRVTQPVRGEIYILRLGTTATKIRY